MGGNDSVIEVPFKINSSLRLVDIENIHCAERRRHMTCASFSYYLRHIKRRHFKKHESNRISSRGERSPSEPQIFQPPVTASSSTQRDSVKPQELFEDICGAFIHNLRSKPSITGPIIEDALNASEKLLERFGMYLQRETKELLRSNHIDTETIEFSRNCGTKCRAYGALYFKLEYMRQKLSPNKRKKTKEPRSPSKIKQAKTAYNPSPIKSPDKFIQENLVNVGRICHKCLLILVFFRKRKYAKPHQVKTKKKNQNLASTGYTP